MLSSCVLKKEFGKEPRRRQNRPRSIPRTILSLEICISDRIAGVAIGRALSFRRNRTAQGRREKQDAIAALILHISPNGHRPTARPTPQVDDRPNRGLANSIRATASSFRPQGKIVSAPALERFLVACRRLGMTVPAEPSSEIRYRFSVVNRRRHQNLEHGAISIRVRFARCKCGVNRRGRVFTAGNARPTERGA